MFINPLFNNILKDVENESISEKKCLISRLDILPYNSITLSCNHCYRVDYFIKILKKKPVKCPYCRNIIDIESIKKTCSFITKKNEVCNKITYCDTGLCKIHGKPKCTFILKNGKKCGKNQFINDKCNIHYNKN